MSNFGLPEGWVSDYDGKRWFYTYKATGVVQYKWPQPGDEYPDFLTDFGSMPILPPEDRLASQQQMRAVRPSEPRKQYASGMSATGGPMNFYDHEEFGKTDFFQPDALMYMGPGAYNDVSPIVGEDIEQPPPDSALGLPNSLMPSTAKVSPMGSQKSTPMTSSSQMVTGSSSNTHFELHSQHVNFELHSNSRPAELPHDYIAELPLPTPQASQAPPMPPLSSEMHGINMLDSRPIQPPAQSATQSSIYYTDPVGVIAEMPTNSTVLSSFEMAPVEMADPRVLAPIEEAALEVPAMAELPHIPANPQKMKQISQQRVLVKRKQLAYADHKYPFQPTEDPPEPSPSDKPASSVSPTPQPRAFDTGMVTTGSSGVVPGDFARRASAPVVQSSVPTSLSERSSQKSVLASLRTPLPGPQSTPQRSTSYTPQPFPINIPDSIAPDGSNGVHKAPLTLRPGVLADNTALPPIEPPTKSLSPDNKPFSVLPYPDDNHGPGYAVILDIEPRDMVPVTRDRRADSGAMSPSPPQLRGRVSMPLTPPKVDFSGKRLISPKPPKKPAYLSGHAILTPPRSDSASPRSVSPLGTPSPGIGPVNRPDSVTATPNDYSVAPLNIRRTSEQLEIPQPKVTPPESGGNESSVWQDGHRPSISQISMVSTPSQDLHRTTTGSSVVSQVSSPSVSDSSASYVSPGQSTPGTTSGQGSYFPPIKGQQPFRIPTLTKAAANRRQSCGLASELSRQRQPSSPKIKPTGANLSMSIGPTLSIPPKTGSPFRDKEFNRPQSMLLLNSVSSDLQQSVDQSLKKFAPENPAHPDGVEIEESSLPSNPPIEMEASQQMPRTIENKSPSTEPSTVSPKPTPTAAHQYKYLPSSMKPVEKPRPVSLPALAQPTVFAASAAKPEKQKGKWRLSRFFKGPKNKNPPPEPSFKVYTKPQAGQAVNFEQDLYHYSHRPVLDRTLTPVANTPSPHPDVDPIDHQDGLRSNSPFVEPPSQEGLPEVLPDALALRFVPPPNAVEMPAEVYSETEPQEMSASPIKEKSYMPLLPIDSTENSGVSRSSSDGSNGRSPSFVVVELSGPNADKESGISDRASLSTVEIVEAQANPVMRPQLVQVSSSSHNGHLSPRLPSTSESTAQSTAQPNPRNSVSATETAPKTSVTLAVATAEAPSGDNSAQAQLQAELMKFLGSRSKAGADEESSPSSLDEDIRPVTPAGQTLSQPDVHALDCTVAPLVTPRRSPATKSPAPVGEVEGVDAAKGVNGKTESVAQVSSAGEGEGKENSTENSKWAKVPKADYSGGDWDDDEEGDW